MLILTLIAYWPVYHCGFVNFDDPDYIQENVTIQKGLTSQGVVWAFTTAHSSNWHPLTWLSLMLDCQLFGLNPGMSHVVNVLLHVGTTLLLFLLLDKMTDARWRSAMVAAFFALHPMHVESVAWIAERKDVLCAFFFVATILAYVQYARKPGLWRYLPVFGLFALALMSKPMAVTLPFVLLLLDYWPLQRVRVKVESEGRVHSPLSLSLFRLILEKIPMFALVVASSMVTVWAQKKGGTVLSLATLSISGRIFNSAVAYVRYLADSVYPVNMAIIYTLPPQWVWWKVAGAIVLLLTITVVAIRFIKSRPYLLIGWLWFLGTLVPVIGIVQVGIQSKADRYTYLPYIGLFIAVIWIFSDRIARKLFPVAAILLLACIVGVRYQLQFWRGSEELFSHATKVTADNYIAYNNLGFWYLEHTNYDQAITFTKKAIALNPTYHYAEKNLAYIYEKMGRNAEAIEHYAASLRIIPDQPDALSHLGGILIDQGRVAEGTAQLERAVQLNPQDVHVINSLALGMAAQKNFGEAARYLREELKILPDNPDALSNLGNALASDGKFTEAIASYFEALKLRPNDAQAHGNLATALLQSGKPDQALEHYLAAVKISPDDFTARLNCGLVLLQLGKRAEAKPHLIEAVRMNPNSVEAKNALKAAGGP